MVRRQFIRGVACGLGVGPAAGGSKIRKAAYHIEGFTCITCAVGLDTLLKEEKGIVHSKSSYADRTSIVEYDSDQIREEEIRVRIQEFGFRAVIS
jgi:copper chaperone CopZ